MGRFATLNFVFLKQKSMKTAIGQNPSLSGRKVIVLGGSSGLGLATAKAAAAEGANVTIVSGNRQRIDQALTQLQGHGHAEGYAIDLGLEENIKSFLDRKSVV